MDFITTFFGRFHPLLVHLPIGILFLAFLFECLSFRERYKKLGKLVQPALFWGSMFAVAAAMTGFFLRQEGGYEEDLADLHQNFGIITAVLSLIVYVVRPKVKYWVDHRHRRKQVKLALSIPLILVLLVTGHWGGSLTHGEDYLFAAMTVAERQDLDPADKIRTITDVNGAILFDDVIEPILEARCYDCHSSTKQKGELRLDSKDFILRGGESGSIIKEGPADSSALFARLVLPLEHEDHMPPNEKPQLSSSEIALIKYWLEEKAPFDAPVSKLQNHSKITAIITSLQASPEQSWIPQQSVSAASGKTLQKLNDLGVRPMPLAAESNYLMVTFTGSRNIADEQMKSLREIEDQLVWLNLSHTAITDDQLEALSGLRNLRVLYLNNTNITDAGLSKIASLKELRSLSLVGTPITDASVETFSKLPNLTNLFVFRTSVTSSGIKKLLEADNEIKIDTGNYMLKKLPTDTIVYEQVSAR
ncbi:MAG TPA: DUF2231 domain-containing protein [Chryseosolibacter sp.]|nr:DUF2231 domain-containing protein [Chryseosolibacter sp.]